MFTIVLLTGNTMSQALRERVPELAVLKTLGFTDVAVSLLVLGEAILLCLVGGFVGVVLAFFVRAALAPMLVGFLGEFHFSAMTLILAAGLAVLIGLVVGMVPALTAKRLTIVDALRER